MAFSRPSFWNSIPSVVKNLLIINIILFLATLAFSRWGIDLNNILGMHYWQADKFQVWQLVSFGFMHGGLTHIFFNMLALIMFGSPLEHAFGARRFLVYYMITGIGAGIIQQIFWTVDLKPLVETAHQYSNSAEVIAYINAHITVGASGSIFGILLAFGWLFPQAELFMLFIPVPIKARWAVAIYAIAELFFGVANFRWDNIAHFAHLGGMLFGAILILIWRKNKFR